LCKLDCAATPDRSSIDQEAELSAVLYRLSHIHRRLDDEIRREASRRVPDGFRLLRLKKLKLAVKDRLSGHWRRALVVTR
jgi:hypothetical protein